MPRHGRSYGDLARLHAQINSERVDALRAFHTDVAEHRYPDDTEIATIDANEFAEFIGRLKNEHSGE